MDDKAQQGASIPQQVPADVTLATSDTTQVTQNTTSIGAQQQATKNTGQAIGEPIQETQDAPQAIPQTQQDDAPPVVTVPAPQAQATRPVQSPILPGSKEHEPVAAAPVEKPVEVVAKPTENAPEISKELRELGVEHSNDVKEQEGPIKVEVAPTQPEPAAVPQSQDQQETAQFGMTYTQALAKVKTSPIRDSVRWFAAEIIFQLKRLHQPNP